MDFVKEPKISVIITYYNLGKYIQECIDSILNQQYKNFEIIIVNDFSDEKNTAILSGINNEKIKIINLSENKGQLLAFCEGLKIADGEFVCMIDADDVLLPHYLQTLLNAHLNDNFALISSTCAEINEKNEIISLKPLNNPIRKQKNKKIEDLFKEEEYKIIKNKEVFGLWNWNPSTSAMFRKTALDILDFFPDKGFWKTGADKVIFSILDLVGASANIDSVCYLYRHHSENNSQTSLTSGNKKYLTENYVKKLILWNKKLRFDVLKMFLKNKKQLIQKYNKINYLKMLFRIIFCVNFKVCTKIIKAFAHKLINF